MRKLILWVSLIIFLIITVFMIESTRIKALKAQDGYQGPTLIAPPPPESVKTLTLTTMSKDVQIYYLTDPVERMAAIQELSREPHFGTVRVPIVCVEFPDKEHELSTLEVQEIYDELTKYFSWISYGQVEVVFNACIGGQWFTTLHEFAYYRSVYPANMQGLVEWVIKEADKSVDFSPFGNGDASGVVGVITAGSQDTAPLSGIVGHAWVLPNPVIADGVEFSHYHSVTEFFKESGRSYPIPLGVAAHEAGHNLWGWWDLYDPNGGGIGYWSLMSYGAWGGSSPGSTPTNLDPWHKYWMGWLEPNWVEATTRINLLPYEKEPQAVGLRLNNSEYFLGVNYQPLDYDRSLGEAAGLVLFHINEDSIGQVFEGDPAAPKCVWPRPYMVMVEEADGVYDLLTRYVQPYWHRSDTFPGSTHTTRLFADDPGNRPNLATYQNCGSLFEIFGVELVNNEITFTIIKRPLPYQFFFPFVSR